MSFDKWIANKDVASSGIGDDVALLDPVSRQYFTLNATGAVIWAALSSAQTIDQLTEKVAHDFDITPDDCAPDVRALIAQLSDAGLIGKV